MLRFANANMPRPVRLGQLAKQDTIEYHFPSLQQAAPFPKHNEGIIMQAVKQEALNTIARLPEDADMEEIMYRLYVLENIRRGQQDATQGKTQSAEEVLRDIQTW
jgi:predicted transcriptional regulator